MLPSLSYGKSLSFTFASPKKSSLPSMSLSWTSSTSSSHPEEGADDGGKQETLK